MIAPKKGPVLRVTGLAASQPDGELATELKAAISDSLTDQEQSQIDISIAVVPSCYSDEEKMQAGWYQQALHQSAHGQAAMQVE
jgi:hypothetical protein